MAEIDFVQALHSATKRDYLDRVTAHDKAECSEVAGRFGAEYWDGDRRYGYGGYRYDGRWLPVAEAMARHYEIGPGARILDVGCGKGFLLYEFTRVVPGVEISGIDVSSYALEQAKPEVSDFLQCGNATDLPDDDGAFDFVVSLGTLHNLHNYELREALGEIERVSRGASYVLVESYRSEREKANLLYWQLTCRAFHTPREWEWLYSQAGYSGDHGFIFFE